MSECLGQISVFQEQRPLTKCIRLDTDGRIVSDGSGCLMACGCGRDPALRDFLGRAFWHNDPEHGGMHERV